MMFTIESYCLLQNWPMYNGFIDNVVTLADVAVFEVFVDDDNLGSLEDENCKLLIRDEFIFDAPDL